VYYKLSIVKQKHQRQKLKYVAASQKKQRVTLFTFFFLPLLMLIPFFSIGGDTNKSYRGYVDCSINNLFGCLLNIERFFGLSSSPKTEQKKQQNIMPMNTHTPTNTPSPSGTPAPSVNGIPAGNSNINSCLPPNIKLTDIVSTELISFSAANGYTVKKITVAQKLTDLQASCAANGKLVDGTGREIYFYQLTGCWGNPPFNYQGLLAKQQQELQQLRQQYTVIEMTCNPSGIPPA
jgi:hypothetical protein